MMGCILRFLKRNPRRHREHVVPNWMWLTYWPDFAIGGDGDPYLIRWYLTPRLPLPSGLFIIAAHIAAPWIPWWPAIFSFGRIYLHAIRRSDDDRALHDHPATNVSILLRGSYHEIVPDWSRVGRPHLKSLIPHIPHKALWRHAGSVVIRCARDSHRLELRNGPVWTLWVVGPRLREWGFWCPQGWRLWSDFVDPNDPGVRGKGCD